jgi:DNA-binding MarR family transcriptional regulator
MTPPVTPDLAGEAWSLMRDLVLNNERKRTVSDALGMSFGRIRALRRIATRPMPMGELAALLGMDAPNLTIVVDDLQAQGLVERRPHPTDRRAKLVVATRRGKDAARRANAILDNPPTELGELAEAELQTLVRILSQLATDQASRS